MEIQTFRYDNRTVKLFIKATLIWGVVAMLIGLTIALQLALPLFNFDSAYISFGRLRPIHTNGIIFAFIGNAIFAGVYYSMQRLLKTRMYSDFLSGLHFWVWQLIITLAAVSLSLGFTTGKEYAELEWPIDILITITWVSFGINMIGTILRRNVKHIYAAIWWYIATFVGIAILHVVNSFELPVTLFKSYPVFAGAQDAVVQWWYGHNAVAFFLTTPFLGLMYYYLPKAVNRPIYSYTLSIIHFWSLIFLYMWAGPHHLLYQALPGWAQALGTTFSIMLIAPSWGGMINGFMTLRGAWDQVRDRADLKFFAAALTAYGMATFEGPMMSIKTVNMITHFTDWTIAHVHIAGMIWNGGIVFGMLYWLVPKLFKTGLYSKKLANVHFWIATLGVLLYTIPIYWGALTQWIMWQEYTKEGFLAYPNFLETLTQIIPMYHLRYVGGTLYLTGFLIMVYNMYKTMKAGSFVPQEEASAPVLVMQPYRDPSKESVHRWLERRGIIFTVIAFVVLAIGGAVQIIPMTFIKSNVPTIKTVTAYTPLELEGRDIYLKEGCYTCHSQMVRPFRWETDRYGEYSKIGEFVYDHPFQWGSRRIGPDLARAGILGGPMYKSASWHYNHFMDAQAVNKQSIMPNYKWLATRELNLNNTPRKINVMRKLGLPYAEGFEDEAVANLKSQGEKVAAELQAAGITVSPTSHMVAMIAYLHKLGTGIAPQEIPDVGLSVDAAVSSVVAELPKSTADLAKGKEIFAKLCTVCHAADGKGIPPANPDLTDDVWIKGGTPADVVNSITNGSPTKGMVPYKTLLTPEEIKQVASFVLNELNK